MAMLKVLVVLTCVLASSWCRVVPVAEDTEEPAEGNATDAPPASDSDVPQQHVPAEEWPYSSQMHHQLKNIRERMGNITVKRSKEIRMKEIKNQVLSSVGYLRRQPVVNRTLPNDHIDKMRTMFEKFNHREVLKWGASAGYTGKVQSFYPSCELPKNTDEETWSDPELFHIYVNLSHLKTKDESVNIVAAKLRLFKLSKDGAGNGHEAAEPCTPSEETTPSGFLNDLLHEEKIRVSVYWYTRALKKHRSKRKLVDTKMLSSRSEQWVSFDIQRAAISWVDMNRNFGLVVEVEDEDGDILPASTYFSVMNCTEETATARPIPGFLMEAALQDNANASLPLDSPPYPMVDICTIELPEDVNVLPTKLMPTFPGGRLFPGSNDGGESPEDDPEASSSERSQDDRQGLKKRVNQRHLRHRLNQELLRRGGRGRIPMTLPPVETPVESETLFTFHDVDYTNRMGRDHEGDDDKSSWRSIQGGSDSDTSSGQQEEQVQPSDTKETEDEGTIFMQKIYVSPATGSRLKSSR